MIDGGSSDNTLNVIETYRPHLHYFISEKDSGQSEAINKGLRQATGDIVTWLNSDDYYEPDTLEQVAQLFRNNPDAGFVHGKARLFGKNKKDIVVGTDRNLQIHEYLAYMRFPQPASFFRKEAMAAAGPLNEQLHYAMDFELVVKSLLSGFKPVRSSSVFAHYRLHENSKTNHDLRFIEEWSRVVFRVLSSFAGGEKYAAQLKLLTSMEIMDSKIFDLKVRLNDDVLRALFLEHLHIRFHYQYRALQVKDAKQTAAYIRKNYPREFAEKGYGKYTTRLKILPTFVLALLRKFST